MKSENKRLAYEQLSMKEKIKENKDKIKLNKQLPYLVGNVVEVGREGEQKRDLIMKCARCPWLTYVLYASLYFIH